MVISDAFSGASPGLPLLDGSICLMPASVRADADAVVGVVVPDDSGVIGAGAITVMSSH